MTVYDFEKNRESEKNDKPKISEMVREYFEILLSYFNEILKIDYIVF